MTYHPSPTRRKADVPSADLHCPECDKTTLHRAHAKGSQAPRRFVCLICEAARIASTRKASPAPLIDSPCEFDLRPGQTVCPDCHLVKPCFC